MILLWEGHTPLSSVTWCSISNSTYSQFPQYEATCMEIWKKKIARYPQLYDGDILFVEDHEIRPHSLSFRLSTIKYSLITTLFECGVSLPEWYGSLGFQALLYNPDHAALLVGRRATNSDYKPGYYAPPGGIFERIDLGSSPTAAVLRELHEETAVPIVEDSFVLRAVVREHNQVCLIFLVECTIPAEIDLRGNEEWENLKLEWIPLQNLLQLGENVLEGIEYLQNQILL